LTDLGKADAVYVHVCVSVCGCVWVCACVKGIGVRVFSEGKERHGNNARTRIPNGQNSMSVRAHKHSLSRPPTHTRTHTHAHKHTHTHTYRQTYRQTDRQTDKHDRHARKQATSLPYIKTFTCQKRIHICTCERETERVIR